MLEAKPFDQNAENWKRENRLFTSTVLEAGASGQNRIGTHALRSHRTVWFVSLLKLMFLVRNWHCWSRKAFPRQMTPQSREKLRKRPFSTPLTGMKSCTVDRGCTPAPKGATKLAVLFRFFRVFPSTFQWKRACRGDLQTFKACFVQKSGKWPREAMISPRSP